MRRGLIRYDENLDASTSTENDSYLSSELDLLNPRISQATRKIQRLYKRSDKVADSPSLFDTSRPSDFHPATSHDPAKTKLLHRKNSLSNISSIQRASSLQCISAKNRENKYEHQVTFAEARYSSGEGPSGKSDSKLWKGRGTPRIIKAIRRHSSKFNREDCVESPSRPREENSKSSVVVLYHGKSPITPLSSKSLVRLSRSENTVVPTPYQSLPTPIGNPSAPRLRPSVPTSEETFSPKAPVRRKKTVLRRYRRSSKKGDPLNVNIYHESHSVHVSPQEVQWNPWVTREKARTNRKDSLRTAEYLAKRQKSPDEREEDYSKVRQQRRISQKDLKPGQISKERCRPSDRSACISRQMANCLNLGREGNVETQQQQQQQQQRCTNGPNLGFLMQHIQSQPRETSDSRAVTNVDGDEAKRVFPFQATPSGNLKIIPNQVVFESKKVSVLVADPRHTKINVKAELSRPDIDIERLDADPGRPDTDFPPGVTPSALNQLQVQQKLPPIESECRPRTQPYRTKHRSVDMEHQQQTIQPVNLRALTLNEVPLSLLGFTGEQPIDWNNIILPEKTDLYQEIARRIINYKNADCIVRLGHDEFHCHLLVLQSYSNFFDEQNCKEIDLTESRVTSKAFSIIYDWMISPIIESCHLLRRDNILEIFTASQYLGIKELEEQCWAFIDNDELFSEDTAFLLYLEAKKIGNNAVMELMIPRIMKFFLMLVSTKDFLELSIEELCLLLRSNYICVNSEMEVLMSAVRWLMHDWEGRRQYLLDVLKCVRFGLIAPWQLVDVKRNPENPEFMELMSYPEVQKMVDDGLAFVIIKYWYGNQTEDYYHWIDLLGLTEPTNRNWAGEDKNYVTYREFLLYLEEYQRTKMSELKSRKPHVKPAPPDSPPKDSPSSPPARRRGNYPQNHGAKDVGSSGSSKQPTKTSIPTYLPPGVSAGAVMSPEILNEYFNNLDRNLKGKNQVIGDGRRRDKPTTFDIRLGGGGETLKRECKAGMDKGGLYDSTNHEEYLNKDDKLVYGEPSDKDVQKVCYCQQGEQNMIFPKSEQHKRYQTLNQSEDNVESAKSEEEAATTIQAVFRGYKARRKFDEIKKSTSYEKQNARRVAELLAIPIGQNLHKPLEPSKVLNNSACQGSIEIQVKQRSPSPRRKKRDSLIVRNRNEQLVQERSDSIKDLEGLQFGIFSPQPTPRSHLQKSLPTDLPTANDPTNYADITKPLQTIKSPAFFQNCDGRTSSVTPSDNTDTDDPFSPRIEARETLYHGTTLNASDDNPYQAHNDQRSRSRSRDEHRRNTSICKRSMPQRMSINVLGTKADSYFLDNSLFFPEREAVLVLGGIDPQEEYGCTGNSGKDMYRFKPADNVWEFVGEIPEPRHHHSVVYLKGRVYLVGGADPQEGDLRRRCMVVGTVWSYDPARRAWFKEPGMLTPRKNFGLVVSHGKMYAIGGQDTNGAALKTVEAFDPMEGVWREMQPMQVARIGAASVKYQNLIWIAGGMTRSKKEPLSRDVECYDPLKNLWSKVEPLRSPRCFASMHVISDSLYVIGGAGRTSNADNITGSIGSIDVWDPNLRTWRQQTEMSIARHGHSVGSIGDQLLIIGGVTTVFMKTLQSVECYCCERSKWLKGVSALPYAISGHGTVSLPPAKLLVDS